MATPSGANSFRRELENRCTKLTIQTAFSKFFVFGLFSREGSAVCYHDDQLGGLVKVIRAFLHVKFNRYRDLGSDAFKNTLPVIYTNTVAPAGIVQYLCKQ
ncbi:unnamed protein product, partial [Nesidiocoris tenuis]